MSACSTHAKITGTSKHVHAMSTEKHTSSGASERLEFFIFKPMAIKAAIITAISRNATAIAAL
jgi:hypothetical protein